MALKACKWCGREFDNESRSASSAGNWYVCSESCRQNLSLSLATGEIKPSPVLSSGCMVLIGLVILFFVVGYLTNGDFGSKTTSHQNAPIEQSIETEASTTVTNADEPAEANRVADDAPVQELPGHDTNNSSDANRAIPDAEENDIPAQEPRDTTAI